MGDAMEAAGPGRPVIVIFGAAVRPDGQPSRTLRLRVEAAAAFGRRLGRPLYVPTGGVGRFGPAEAEVMVGLLRALGVAAADIRPEATAHDTVSSVRAVRRMLAEEASAAPVFAATSAYHLARCVVLLRLAGLPALPCPPPPALAAAQWRKRWWWRLREVPALPWDAAYVLGLRLSGRL